MSSDLRFIVQDVLTGDFLHWDLPLEGASITYALSGATTITADMTPEMIDLVNDAQPWGTWLHVEDAGQIRASTLVMPGSYDDETFKISTESVSGYPHGMVYLGNYSQVNVDPLDIVREVWNHLQSYQQGNVAVSLSDVHTTVRVGTDTDTDGTLKPYTVAWWDNKDCGQIIDDLAKSTPFDYRDSPSWNDDKTSVNQLVELGFPRLGRRRYDLRFVQDENITDIVPLKELDDEYASDVLVLGSGQGQDAIRGFYSEVVAGRLRRTAVLTDQSITDVNLANRVAQDEFRRRQAALRAIDQITVDLAHDNAKLGTFAAGDDILVQATLPWVGDIQLWHRITSWTHDVESETATLKLQRSETFRYGINDVFVSDEWIMDDPVLSVMDLTATIG